MTRKVYQTVLKIMIEKPTIKQFNIVFLPVYLVPFNQSIYWGLHYLSSIL